MAETYIPSRLNSDRNLKKNAFKKLTKWLSLAGQDAENASICYGGNESYKRFGVTIIPWEQVGNLMDE